MDDRLESLRTENKKLRGKHNELESNLTEEKEMVRYLHGVIKNYQQLLKKPETTRHLKTASLKKVRRSYSGRRLTSEKDVEELFVKNLVCEMSNAGAAEGKEENMEQFVPNDNNKCVVRDTSDCENTDNRINNKSQVSDEALSAVEYEKAELTPDTDKMFWDVKGQRSSGSQRNSNIPLEEMHNERETDSKYFDRERILQEMTHTLDSMMAKATVLEKSLKQKDKHLKKMERRYEYLENIALGEESEWL